MNTIIIKSTYPSKCLRLYTCGWLKWSNEIEVFEDLFTKNWILRFYSMFAMTQNLWRAYTYIWQYFKSLQPFFSSLFSIHIYTYMHDLFSYFKCSFQFSFAFFSVDFSKKNRQFSKLITEIINEINNWVINKSNKQNK